MSYVPNEQYKVWLPDGRSFTRTTARGDEEVVPVPIGDNQSPEELERELINRLGVAFAKFENSQITEMEVRNLITNLSAAGIGVYAIGAVGLPYDRTVAERTVAFLFNAEINRLRSSQNWPFLPAFAQEFEQTFRKCLLAKLPQGSTVEMTVEPLGDDVEVEREAKIKLTLSLTVDSERVLDNFSIVSKNSVRFTPHPF